MINPKRILFIVYRQIKSDMRTCYFRYFQDNSFYRFVNCQYCDSIHSDIFQECIFYDEIPTDTEDKQTA